MATFNHELHKQLIERKKFALAALVVDGFITDGKSLMLKQQEHKTYFANKRAIIKNEIEKHQTKVMRHLYKDWLLQKHAPESNHPVCGIESWEHYTTC